MKEISRSKAQETYQNKPINKSCIVCGENAGTLYGGLCIACLAVRAEDEENQSKNEENMLNDIEINTPLNGVSDLVKILRTK